MLAETGQRQTITDVARQPIPEIWTNHSDAFMVISKLLEHHSKANHQGRAYSEALCQIRRVVNREECHG